MGKRFIDTEIFRTTFYKSLPMEYKLLWQLLLCECDCAGIWHVELDIAQLRIGSSKPLDADEALRYFNDRSMRVLPFDNGRKWFICDFIHVQTGALRVEIEDGKPKGNRWHMGIYQRLLDNDLAKYINISDGSFVQNADNEAFQQKSSPLQAPNMGLKSPYEGCKELIVNSKESKVDIDSYICAVDLSKPETLFPAVLFPNPRKLSSADYETFRQQFNGVFRLSPIPKLTRTLNDGRKKAINARLREVGYDVSTIGQLFYIVLHSPFLLGWTASDRAWKCNFDFMFSPSGFSKILDNNYEIYPEILPYDESTYTAICTFGPDKKQAANEAAILTLKSGGGANAQTVSSDVAEFF